MNSRTGTTLCAVTIAVAVLIICVRPCSWRPSSICLLPPLRLLSSLVASLLVASLDALSMVILEQLAVLQSRKYRKRMIVKGERLERAILAVLADKELQKILDAAMYQSKSANQIIRESNISHSTGYRKIG